MKDQVLRILIPNEPTGYKIIELDDWKGKCFVVPRTDLVEISKRPESRDPGIYFLFGDADQSTSQPLYIGESEKFFERLQSHDATKGFWNTAIIFTGSLDRAKIKYLEYMSVLHARDAGRYSLQNGLEPKENSLSEFDLITTKNYFNKINFILSVLQYPVFQKISDSISDQTIYYLKGEHIDARAQLLADGSFNVLKDSLARIRTTETFIGWSKSAREEFIKDGTLIPKDANSYVYTRDVLFKSPSAAAATTTGRSINGWTAWKDEKGATLDENMRK